MSILIPLILLVMLLAAVLVARMRRRREQTVPVAAPRRLRGAEAGVGAVAPVDDDRPELEREAAAEPRGLMGKSPAKEPEPEPQHEPWTAPRPSARALIV